MLAKIEVSESVYLRAVNIAVVLQYIGGIPFIFLILFQSY